MNYFLDLYNMYTEKFSVPYVDKSFPSDFNYTPEEIHDVIKNISRDGSGWLTKYVRVYIGSRRLDGFDVSNVIEKIAHEKNIVNMDWDALFPEEAFLIFINFAGLYSESIPEKTANLSRTLFSKFVGAALSTEHHIIIGRYEETAFGIHLDDAQDRVWHFNVGPEKKSLTLWGREEFSNAHPGEQVVRFEKHRMSHGIEYEFDPKEAFFLPADYYHIGSTKNKVNISLVVAFTHNRPFQIIKIGCENIVKNLQKEFPDEHDFHNFVPEDDFEEACRLIASKKLCDIKSYVDDFRCRLASNAGSIEFRLPKKSNKVTAMKSYIIRDFLEIIKSESLGVTRYYSRGDYVEIKNNGDVRLIDRIIREKIFSFSDAERDVRFPIVAAFKCWLVYLGTAF